MKKSENRTDYWIFRLGFTAFLKILKRHRRDPIGQLTCLHITGITSWCLVCLERLRWIKFRHHKVAPRPGPAGPILCLSEVRDAEGRVITFSVFHHVVKLRGKILDELLDRIDIDPLVRDKGSLHILKAWIGLKIAEEINPLVFLSCYAHWNSSTSVSGLKNRKNVLVIADSAWTDLLSEYLLTESLVDEVMVVKNRSQTFKGFLFLSLRIFLSIFNTLKSWLIRSDKAKKSPKNDRSKVFIQYALGLNGTLRNDIPFAEASDFDLSRLFCLIVNPNHFPEPSEIKWMRENNITLRSSPELTISHPDIQLMKSTGRRKEEWRYFCKTFLQFFLLRRKSREKYSFWLLFHLWEFGKSTSLWKDCFFSHDIKIAVWSVPSAKQFLMSYALSEIGGISIETERSILYDYTTYLHNFPSHIRFVTGPYSQTQMAEPSNSLYTLQCGLLQTLKKHRVLEGLDAKAKTRPITIAVFDELPSDWFFGNSIRQFYTALIDLAQKDSRFYLIVKTKKNQVLERMQDIKTSLKQLEQAGQCTLLDWKVSVISVALHSDLAVSVPSTAAFECVLAGTRTIVFNPMRSGMSLFYSDRGLNRRIFESGEGLISGLKKFAEGDLSIGDCRDLLPKLDALRDGRGPERVATYIQQCLDAFDAGQKREDILRNTNRGYTEIWGDEKLSG